MAQRVWRTDAGTQVLVRDLPGGGVEIVPWRMPWADVIRYRVPGGWWTVGGAVGVVLALLLRRR